MERVFHEQRPDGHEIELVDHDDRIVGAVDGREVVVGHYTRDNISEFRSQVVYCRGFCDGHIVAQTTRKTRKRA